MLERRQERKKQKLIASGLCRNVMNFCRLAPGIKKDRRHSRDHKGAVSLHIGRKEGKKGSIWIPRAGRLTQLWSNKSSLGSNYFSRWMEKIGGANHGLVRSELVSFVPLLQLGSSFCSLDVYGYSNREQSLWGLQEKFPLDAARLDNFKVRGRMEGTEECKYHGKHNYCYQFHKRQHPIWKMREHREYSNKGGIFAPAPSSGTCNPSRSN